MGGGRIGVLGGRLCRCGDGGRGGDGGSGGSWRSGVGVGGLRLGSLVTWRGSGEDLVRP